MRLTLTEIKYAVHRGCAARLLQKHCWRANNDHVHLQTLHCKN